MPLFAQVLNSCEILFRIGILKLTVAEASKLVEYFASLRSTAVILQLFDRRGKIVVDDLLRFLQSSFRNMMGLRPVSIPSSRKGCSPLTNLASIAEELGAKLSQLRSTLLRICWSVLTEACVSP